MCSRRIVLGLLGVSDDDIVTDYALTHEVIEKIHVLRGDTAGDRHESPVART